MSPKNKIVFWGIVASIIFWVALSGEDFHHTCSIASADDCGWFSMYCEESVGTQGQIIGTQGQKLICNWTHIPGGATDIGIGATGIVWVIGANGIYRWNGKEEENGSPGEYWDYVAINMAKAIDVDPDGNPWVIQTDWKIWRRTNERWVNVPGGATDVGIGANRKVWVIGANGVYRWNGKKDANGSPGEYWDYIAINKAKAIDVAPDGNPWVIQTDWKIWRRINGNKGRWVNVPGGATDVGIGVNGTVWVIGANGVYRWNGKEEENGSPGKYWDYVFIKNPKTIAVDAEGNPWVIDTGGQIYKGTIR